MTISYAKEVPNGSAFGCFWGILWKWRGSVYKLVWRELLAYLVLYYTINFVYRYALNEEQKVVFEKIRLYFGAQSESIPMSFVLGFYVSLIVKRWWEQYRMLPWPDTLALFISAAIPGQDETGRLMRRNIMRYYCMAYVITLQRISLRVKKRFPTLQHLVDAGLMLESERKIFVLMDAKSPMAKYWMPLVWATNILNRARKEGIIASDHIIQTILFELSDIRRRLGGLIGYDTVCVPLVYTQVVTLVLYSYFMAALMGRQMVPRLNGATGKYEDPDLYFPLFTALQFVFYVGWLKVAEVLINPFGEDDDDIELNWLIDRHIKASYMIVDEMHEEHPELLKDQYWEEVVPKDLPYTVASEHYRKEEPKGSAEDYKIKEADAVYANINVSTKRSTNEDNYADYESVDTPMVERRKNWFSRQLTRMGSMRSSSQYSSTGGLFTRNRQNSVYSSPEAQLPGVNGQMQQNPAKMSFYDKFVGRKSGRTRGQLQKQNSKLSLNGAVMSNMPNRGTRPRIPTPDVTKEVTDRDNRVIFGNSHPMISGNHSSSVASGVALMTQQLATTPSMYPTNVSAPDVPVLGTFLLSPIKELDTGSLNNTLHANSPSTMQLAKALQNSGIVTDSPTLSRIITVSSAGDSSDTSVVNSSMPVVSVILPTTTAASINRGALTSVPISIPVTLSQAADTTLSLPADSAHMMETGSVPSRRKFEVSRKESLSKSTSLDSAVSKAQKEKEAVEKRKSDGGKPTDGKTGEVYV